MTHAARRTGQAPHRYAVAAARSAATPLAAVGLLAACSGPAGPAPSPPPPPAAVEHYDAPDVTGLTVREAADAAAALGTDIATSDARYGRLVGAYEEWVVCSQDPPPGVRRETTEGLFVVTVRTTETCPAGDAPAG